MLGGLGERVFWWIVGGRQADGNLGFEGVCRKFEIVVNVSCAKCVWIEAVGRREAGVGQSWSLATLLMMLTLYFMYMKRI